MFGIGVLGSLGVVPGGGGPSYDPAIAVFAGGAGAGGYGGFYANLGLQSSLYQDASGTVPITAAGQPIGKANDLSGNSTLITASGTSRPAWQADGSGLFDGLDDVLQTLLATDTTIGTFLLSSLITNPSSAGYCGAISGANTRLYSGVNAAGLSSGTWGTTTTGALQGSKIVRGLKTIIGLRSDGNTISLFENGVVVASVARGLNVTSTLPIWIGASNDAGAAHNLITGKIYKSLYIKESLPDPEIANITTYWSTH